MSLIYDILSIISRGLSPCNPQGPWKRREEGEEEEEEGGRYRWRNRERERERDRAGEREGEDAIRK